MLQFSLYSPFIIKVWLINGIGWWNRFAGDQLPKQTYKLGAVSGVHTILDVSTELHKNLYFQCFQQVKTIFFLTSTVASFINEIISIPGCNNRNPKKVLILFLTIEDKTWGKQKQQLIHQFILKNKSLFLPNLALFYEWSFPIYFQVMCFLDCTTNTWLNCSLKNKIIFPCNDWN